MKKNLFKKIAVMLMVTVMMLGVLVMNAAAISDPEVDKAEDAVVKVVREVIVTKNGIPSTTLISVGSGVLIAAGDDATETNRVLASYPVVETGDIFYVKDYVSPASPYYAEYSQYNGLSINFVPNITVKKYIILNNNLQVSYRVDAQIQDANAGWAMLTLDKKVTDVYTLKAAKSSELLVNNEVWALGYPANYEMGDDIVQKYGSINQLDYKIDGIVNPFILHTAATQEGNVGGPLVDGNGNIVGLVVRTNNDGTFSCAVPIDDIVEKAGMMDVEIMLDDGGLDWIMLAVIGAIAVVVLAGIIVLIVVLAKRSHAAPAEEEPAAVPHVMVQSGRLAGQRYRIEGSVKIGRDGSQCNIVYPTDTAGVSGTHCEVFLQNGNVYLRDLKSSYGTFLGNGMRLQPGVAIMVTVGSTFYLASPENTFIVRY